MPVSTKPVLSTSVLSSAIASSVTVSKPRVAVVLMNLGTPDAPTPAAVRKFLKQFLSDQRVIEIPRLLWAIILNLFVLPFRPKRVAKAYASIWQDGDSPMRLILQQQVDLLADRLQQRFSHVDVRVLPAMSYGAPSTSGALDQIRQAGIEHVIVLPLFPQYSATSTGAAIDAVNQWTSKQRDMLSICVIKDYYQHPLLIKALAQTVREYQQEHGQPDKLRHFSGVEHHESIIFPGVEQARPPALVQQAFRRVLYRYAAVLIIDRFRHCTRPRPGKPSRNRCCR